MRKVGDEMVTTNKPTIKGGGAVNNISNQIPLVLTLKEAASLLRLDSRTVRLLYRRGEIVGGGTGHRTRLSYQSVIDWASGKCASGSKEKIR
jgi:excisionase family DNA binding protein